MGIGTATPRASSFKRVMKDGIQNVLGGKILGDLSTTSKLFLFFNVTGYLFWVAILMVAEIGGFEYTSSEAEVFYLNYMTITATHPSFTGVLAVILSAFGMIYALDAARRGKNPATQFTRFPLLGIVFYLLGGSVIGWCYGEPTVAFSLAVSAFVVGAIVFWWNIWSKIYELIYSTTPPADNNLIMNAEMQDDTVLGWLGSRAMMGSIMAHIIFTLFDYLFAIGVGRGTPGMGIGDEVAGIVCTSVIALFALVSLQVREGDLFFGFISGAEFFFMGISQKEFGGVTTPPAGYSYDANKFYVAAFVYGAVVCVWAFAMFVAKPVTASKLSQVSTDLPINEDGGKIV